MTRNDPGEEGGTACSGTEMARTVARPLALRSCVSHWPLLVSILSSVKWEGQTCFLVLSPGYRSQSSGAHKKPPKLKLRLILIQSELLGVELERCYSRKPQVSRRGRQDWGPQGQEVTELLSGFSLTGYLTDWDKLDAAFPFILFALTEI